MSGCSPKGDVIILTSKYGKETEVEIHNLVKPLRMRIFIPSPGVMEE